MDREKIKRMIEIYQKQREQIMTMANLQVAQLNGAIEALQQLLEEQDTEQQASQ